MQSCVDIALVCTKTIAFARVQLWAADVRAFFELGQIMPQCVKKMNTWTPIHTCMRLGTATSTTHSCKHQGGLGKYTYESREALLALEFTVRCRIRVRFFGDFFFYIEIEF